MRIARTVVLGLAALVALAPPARPALGAAFTVDGAADAVDVSPGDGVCATTGGQCSLRAAIQEATPCPAQTASACPPASTS